jgi:phage shock protein PspC (stress-responsive transcriptional regulator)
MVLQLGVIWVSYFVFRPDDNRTSDSTPNSRPPDGSRARDGEGTWPRGESRLVRRRMIRPSYGQGRWVAGVCAALSERLGWEPYLLRSIVGVVALYAAIANVELLSSAVFEAYAILWFVLPASVRGEVLSPAQRLWAVLSSRARRTRSATRPVAVSGVRGGLSARGEVPPRPQRRRMAASVALGLVGILVVVGIWRVLSGPEYETRVVAGEPETPEEAQARCRRIAQSYEDRGLRWGGDNDLIQAACGGGHRPAVKVCVQARTGERVALHFCD